ncbi:tryptophan halogenase family protein [Sphingomonas quercus]|uniref:Tryptophan 7-halogenase n=1 Tax=Sphingomonas quercus TaxID=2842451 RepID=A0ABS6BG71_9SPHN|nr:tryptophan halogenase family protein [Sphingomonas quercus]MBU3076827.1 tryptophan 7-halogenase [Sphingomonas quercus]
MSEPGVRTVVILGGGTAGWMAAAALSRALKGSGRRILLVESDEIGIVGVGEATIPTIHWFNQLVGLDERAFMTETNATYKLGIAFEGWNGPGSAYLHPFGTFGPPGDGVMFLHRLIRARLAGMAGGNEEFSLTAQAARAGRFARPVADRRSLLSTLGYAFHFDASLYGRCLRGHAEANGVVRIEGKVARVERHGESGDIARLVTERGEVAEGELFVDCSGFRGLLIEQELATGFDDWSEWLPCDRAWAAPTARERMLVPYTRAIAAEAGWRWRIPLQHRTGNGYVFSSRFQDEEAARASFLAALGEAPLAEPRLLRFLPGQRKRSWNRNVVAIGLSSGFLEPLESTSIHLIQSGIAKLLALFPRHGADPLVAEQFNRVFAQEMLDVRDFLILHYAMTEGRGEPLWRHCQSVALPDSLAYRIAHFRASGRLVLSTDELFRDASWFAVMEGQGIEPADYNPAVETDSIERVVQHVESVRAAIRAHVAELPALPW